MNSKALEAQQANSFATINSRLSSGLRINSQQEAVGRTDMPVLFPKDEVSISSEARKLSEDASKQSDEDRIKQSEDMIKRTNDLFKQANEALKRLLTT